jgi:hypothetical protein
VQKHYSNHALTDQCPEVGRDKTADELLEIKNKVVKYLKQILLNIEQYLANKEYLDTSIASTP